MQPIDVCHPLSQSSSGEQSCEKSYFLLDMKDPIPDSPRRRYQLMLFKFTSVLRWRSVVQKCLVSSRSSVKLL